MSWIAETNIKGPKGDKGDAGPPGGLGEAPVDGQTYGRNNAAWSVVTGSSSSATNVSFTPAGNVAASNVQAAIAEVDTEKVAKAGDTMTGNLLINKSNPSLVLQKTAAGQAGQLAGYNGANPRWSIALGDSAAEGGSNAGSNFTLYRYADAGALIDTPLTINRVNGVVDFTTTPTVSGVPIGGGGSTVYMSDTPPVGAPDKSLWVETDTGLMFSRYNDGTSTQWIAVPAGVPSGIVRYDTAQSLSAVQMAQARDNIGAVLHGYLFGLTLSTAGSSATFSVAPGLAADSTASDKMRLASALSKTTAAWAVGNGNGALDTGTIAATTWYHVFLIKRPDTGVVDVLISLSVAAPTLPVNYTLFRRIGSIKTDGSSQWTAFIQDGDTFTWVTRASGFSVVNPGTAAVTRVINNMPLGIRVEAIVTVGFNAAAGTDNPAAILLSDLLAADQAPSQGFSTVVMYLGAAGSYTGFGQARIFTDTSAQIRTRLQISAAGTTFTVSVIGWVDRRGRDG